MTWYDLPAGLIHLAAVLDDATMPKLTRGHLEKSFGAKVFGPPIRGWFGLAARGLVWGGNEHVLLPIPGSP